MKQNYVALLFLSGIRTIYFSRSRQHKNTQHRFGLSLMLLMLLFANAGWGQTYTHTIISRTWSAYGTQTLSSVDWAATASGGSYWGYEATKGQQFGSSKSPANPLTLTTSDILGTITIIKISTSGASNINGTMAVTVGGVAFSPASITLTTTNTEYTFNGSGSGEILITWNQSSSIALYLKKLVVEYTSGSTPTITLAPTTLSGFNYTVGAGPSAAQS
ncbi:MAG: hypothetical protein PHW19_11130, partial [Salinivirgaceae bacterium]|nr:hypothetical protein [Salinivirgaceae bacterium]